MTENNFKCNLKDELLSGSGARAQGGVKRYFFIAIPIIWSLFQLWITSPLPYYFRVAVFNNTETRAIHLAFAILLAFTAFPMKRGSKSPTIPFYDIILALIAAGSTMYLVIFIDQLAQRSGLPTQMDVIVSFIGVILLLEATRRVMGTPMTIAAGIFLIYAFAGPFMPDMIAHKGATINRAASHFWLTQEGVFGVPLGVSTDVVFLYVLFGAMLEHSGAGNYLTTLSFALLGRFSGGPAKAAVVASGLHGLISGSSIANVLTCGPVTIMLMKKVGFSAEKAGAIEVAAGSNGQIMPPVMGAAAFLMVEYINMPYSQLIKHAFLPAIFAYASLLYIVHIEAQKLGMKGVKTSSPIKMRLINTGLSLSAIFIIVGALHYILKFIPIIFGSYAWIAFILLLLSIYIGLLVASTKYPEYNGDFSELPKAIPTLLSGLYFLIPIAILVWCLMVMEMSAGLAAFYACMTMCMILLTQRPILAFLKREPIKVAFFNGALRIVKSLLGGGRNMVGIALATASAGIIVGVVSLTGIGQVLAGVVETISMGQMPIVLVMTAMLAIVLGMGLPTTANYIIVSTLLAPVIYNLSAAHGMEIPLVAIHLFCLYFGVMADATPPVALAAFAASGISGGDPLKTGVQAFIYEMRTAVFPFVFLYNNELLLIGITSGFHLAWVILTSAFACMAFASSTQRFMFTHNKWWETALLLMAMIVLFRPDLPRDLLYPAYSVLPAANVFEEVDRTAPGTNMRLVVESDTGKEVKKRVLVMPVEADAEGKSALERLEEVGLFVDPEVVDGKLIVSDLGINSRAEKVGLDIVNDNSIVGIEHPNERPSKIIFGVPGFILFFIVVASQYRRKKLDTLMS
ncbi:MAG: TRAP transporter permease [Deferribacteraceae bacterium]|jgi:TRAP transporter 4TM/12TM fusion protein|nr:TRAP transporter permease [Deferribacteraceae bacterium]